MNKKEVLRYARQIILPEVGGAGQDRLKGARVLLVGVGGLGSPAAYYLAAAGVGTLVLVDFDRVEPSNLHRQILHFTPDVAKPKVLSAKEKLKALNPRVRVVVKRERFLPKNGSALLEGCDVVLDGSDNFDTRYVVNAACVKERVPLVWGAVRQWEGQVMTVLPGKTPCYACLFPEPPEAAVSQTCSDAGIMGSVAGTVGAMMATEAIKVLLGKGTPLAGRLWSFDLWKLVFRERDVTRRGECGICGRPTASHTPQKAC